ncbi:MAG: M15 family metallopeptidase [Candidatus Dojkabacteria bacterium]
MKIPKPIITIILIIVISVILVLAASLVFKIDLLSEIRSTITTFIKPVSSPVDTSNQFPLEVEIKSGKHETFQPRISLTIISNQDISTDNSDKFKLTFVKDNEGTKYYALEILNLGIGTSTVPVTFKTSSGSTKSLTVAIIRTEFDLPLGLRDISDWENSVYTVDGDNFLVQVNKGHKLVSDYEPTDLVKLFDDKNLLVQTQDLMLRKEAAEGLSLMIQRLMAETGKPLTIASAYRSYNNQFQQYASWVRQLGQEEADKVSARPGFSEHQLGTAIDFMSGDSGYDFVNEFDTTIAGQWLINNSYKYGFVQSYPDGKDAITGYSHEAWHYRYIGIEAAKKWKDSGLTLKEFLEK